MSESGAQADPGRWARRALTLPGVLLLALACLALLPLLLLVSLCVDGVTDRRLPVTRAALFLPVYLLCELAGLAACLVLWAVTRDRDASLRRHYRLQGWWARTLFRGACVLFALRVRIEGDDQVGAGPLVVMMRHASIVDTLLPAVFLAERHGLRLRWVLKRELLWDPCLDVVGQRLPNAFVRRGSDAPEREVALVRQLARGLREGEGILIYPEGTRFTPAKRQRVLDGLKGRGDRAALAYARSLRHVLPPRPGGALALLETCGNHDVLFAGHVGFDGVARLGDVLGGALIGREVRIRFWRIPGASVPEERVARIAWLHAQWQALDAWVGRARVETGLDPAPEGARREDGGQPAWIS